MKTVHSGFVGQSGVQEHSAGDHFPITESTVGGWPPNDSSAFWRIQAPCGVYTDVWTKCFRREVLDAFKLAHETSHRYEGDTEAERFVNAVDGCLWGLDLKYGRD